jgi:hypothetical protein
MTGLTDLRVRVRRSDGLYWCWTNSEFRTRASVVTLNQPLSEADSVGDPGWYRVLFPGATACDCTATFTQSPGTTCKSVPAAAELHIGPISDAHVADLAAAAVTSIAAAVWAVVASPSLVTFGAMLRRLYQRRENRCDVDTVGGGRELLYDDAGENVIATQTLRDGVGGAITTPPGSPARRGAST